MLSKRRQWIGKSRLVPRNRGFNAAGDKKEIQRAAPVLEHRCVKNAGRRVYLLVSANPQITQEEWQHAALRVKEVKKDHHVRNAYIELVVANRLQCFEYFAKMLKIDASNIAYVEGDNIFTPFPDGRWINNTWGETGTWYPVDEPGVRRWATAEKSENYRCDELYKALICFKKQGDRFLPHWLLRGGIQLTVSKIFEEEDEVVINEGFCIGDLSEFTVRLSDGKVMGYNEATYVEVIKLRLHE